MTIESVFAVLTEYRRVLGITCIVIPAIAFVISWMHGVYQGRETPWRQIYALLVHLSTLIVAALLALGVFYVYQGGSPLDPGVPRFVGIVALVGWLLTLLFVKRVVDFEHIRSIRSPILLIISWLVAWTAGFVVYLFEFVLIPGPEYVTVLAAIVLVFLVLRTILRVFARER